MFEEKTIGVIVPAYNEEKLITKTLSTMPDFVDKMYVINDCSTDRTLEIMRELQQKDPRIQIIDHETNKGLGQSLIDGYVAAREAGIDIAAVMAGDAQMNPDDLPDVIGPIARGETDYVKGNRLLRHDVVGRMPMYRYYGNAGLTMLTKFATGYWQIIDPQCGYTAISRQALAVIPIEDMIKGYGYNAHILNMLNLANFTVRDVEVEPVYGEEQSKIKLHKYIPTVSKLLVRLFVYRLVHKYLIREFHPLVFFYGFGIFNAVLTGLLMLRFVILYFAVGEAPQTTLILLSLTTNMTFMNLLFAMWMDMEDNRRLRG